MKKPNARQRTVLDHMLRTLDFDNHYLLGDSVRLAFGIETDSLQMPGREGTSDLARLLKENGMGKGQRYHVPGESKEFRRQWKKGGAR